MAEQRRETGEGAVEQAAGTGIDRTVIRRLLALTPAERVKLAVTEANKLSGLLQKMHVR